MQQNTCFRGISVNIYTYHTLSGNRVQMNGEYSDFGQVLKSGPDSNSGVHKQLDSGPKYCFVLILFPYRQLRAKFE